MLRNSSLKKTFSAGNKRNIIISIIGIITGGLGGYWYYAKIGCVNGTCPITSNPFISVIWGALIGYLLFDLFKLKASKQKKS